MIDALKALPVLAKVAIGIGAAFWLVVAIGLLLPSEKKHDKRKATAHTERTVPAPPKPPAKVAPPAKPKPPRGPSLTENVEAAFNDTLDPKAGRSPRVTDAICDEDGSCVVTYRTRPIAFGGDEILNDQKPIWKRLFDDHRFSKGTFIGTAELTTPGGKTSIGPVMKTTCDRADNREIDWENVQPEGLKQICTVRSLAKGV